MHEVKREEPEKAKENSYECNDEDGGGVRSDRKERGHDRHDDGWTEHEEQGQRQREVRSGEKGR